VLTRVIPLVVLAALAFVAGILIATGPGKAERRLVTHYVQAWQSSDFAQMYSMLDPDSRRRRSEAQFIAAYRNAATTATLLSVTPLHVGGRTGDFIPVRMRIRTRVFGTLEEILEVPLTGSGSGAKVKFSRTLLFPGLKPGEQLRRHTHLAPRATLLASNGTPLAEGPNRTSPIPTVAGEIVGQLGPIPRAETRLYAAAGYPASANVGIDGLEHIFQQQIAGTPGGKLLAGRRILARTRPVRGHTVKTTINPTIEQAAITAMGGNYAGITAMDPRTGALLALAGVAFSGLQPPGSTMKVITATAALDAHLVKLSTTFPVHTEADVGGYILQNAGGEACGGTLLNAFAVSCNSVFAPLGVKVGAARLVRMAERFGFNQRPSIPGAGESTIPSASKIGNATDVGSSAIGQGRVLTSSMAMADVAATIAMGGRRPIPTLQADKPPQFVHVTSRHVAGEVEKMMIAVVQFGTGTSAQIPGVTVAGKTGTAELTNTSAPGGGSAANTDAWFVGYAPAGRPRIAVGALFPNQGAGGQTAAPAVRDVIAASLPVVH
jgi:cell division protein FtsI/penicillin-binding protein 2